MSEPTPPLTIPNNPKNTHLLSLISLQRALLQQVTKLLFSRGWVVGGCIICICLIKRKAEKVLATAQHCFEKKKSEIELKQKAEKVLATAQLFPKTFSEAG